MNEFNEENDYTPEEEIVCRSARMLRTVGAIIVILGFFLGGFGICGSSKADGFFIFLVIVLPSLAIWAFARAIATIAEDIHIMAHKK